MKGTNFPRRDFLGLIATGAAAVGVGEFVAPSSSNAAPLLRDSPGFEEWLGKIQGKHKQVFDAPKPHDGFPLAWARIFLTTNNEVGVPDSDCTAVVVLRHEAIGFGMDHPLWAKYKFGEKFKVEDKATKAPAVRNPYWQPKPGELFFDDMSVDALQKRGVLFGICDKALEVYSMFTAKDLNLDAAELKKEWVAGVLPGIQIVPSGVLAINRAQELGCSYIFTG